ncbi:MAG: 4Fe-4S dicluster domain-containing protein [Bacteroidales bacterium]|nr:4Fe-4S dicluster domain-containing protein [Bacteroidales bacterium]
MGKLYDKLTEDYRIKEGLKACINCGTCTAICPAAEFYKYDPRKIVDIVQSKDDHEIENLLKSEQIWYCGECMSCLTRCPRKNAPGLVIMALRNLSMELGYFVESEKGRQQYALAKIISGNILNYGYCVYARTLKAKDHPEAGPLWEWIEQNMDDVYERNGANLEGEGPGALRRIPQEDLDQLKKIFDHTGATARIEAINRYSMEKAREMGLTPDEYFHHVFNNTEKEHLNQ